MLIPAIFNFYSFVVVFVFVVVVVVVVAVVFVVANWSLLSF